MALSLYKRCGVRGDLVVRDVERSLRFYGQVFGVEEYGHRATRCKTMAVEGMAGICFTCAAFRSVGNWAPSFVTATPSADILQFRLFGMPKDPSHKHWRPSGRRHWRLNVHVGCRKIWIITRGRVLFPSGDEGVKALKQGWSGWTVGPPYPPLDYSRF